MPRSLMAVLLAGVLLLSACGAEDTDTTVTADDLDSIVEEVGSSAPDVADAIAENSEAVEGAIDDAASGEALDLSAVDISALQETVVGTFCENLEEFRTTFEEYEGAEVGSDAEAAAVDAMGQVIGEVEELTAGELPDLVEALRTVEGAAIDFIASDGSSTGTTPGIDEAGETIDSARAACDERG